MKILTKALLITASAISVCGIVLTAAGGAMGGNIGNAFANVPVRVETKGSVRTVPDRSGGSSRSSGGSERGNNGGSRSYGNGGYDSGGNSGGYGSDLDEFYREFFGDDYDIFGDFFGDGYGSEGGGSKNNRNDLEYF